MTVTVVPLLRIARDLYEIPRGPARFRRYLGVLIGGTDDIAYPPLVSLNPMGREHVAASIDALLALDAEAVAVEAAAEAERRLSRATTAVRLGLVVADDLKGGWTNRQYTEMANRFTPQANLKRGWAAALFWTSESSTREGVRREVLEALFRVAHFERHGPPRTLRAMLDQEGRAAAFAGETEPALDAEEIEYTRAVVAPFLDATDLPTQFPCLYGDAAARSVGYTPLGLSPRAGYALALSNALASGEPPESAI
jgi:hypothetical protein